METLLQNLRGENKSYKKVSFSSFSKALLLLAVFGQLGDKLNAQQPIINSVTGTVATGSTLVIDGTMFTTKTNAKPLFWWKADFGVTPSALGRKTAWDNAGGLGNVSTTIVAPGSQQSYGTDHGTSSGAALSQINFDSDQLYLYRKTYEDFDITKDYTIRVISTLVSGTLNVGDIVTGQTSGATGKIVRIVDADPNKPYTHIIQYGNIFGSINAQPKKDFINGEQMTASSGAVITNNEPNGVFRSFNFKTIRFWGPDKAADNSGPNNIHTSAQGTNGLLFRISPEYTDGTTWPGSFTNQQLSQLPREWKTEEVQYQASDIDVYNGIFNFYQKGILGTDNKFRNRTSKFPKKYDKVYQSQVSHNAQPGSVMYYDNLYIDDTWHRVVISTGSTWANRGNVEIQIPAQWNDNQITVQVDLAGLDPNISPLYLYVVDKNGVPNDNGYPLSQGGTPVSVTGVNVSPLLDSVVVGNTLSLQETVLPANASNKNVTWSSSDVNIAGVDAFGVVTGNALGTATITVTTVDGNYTANSSIKVINAIPVDSCNLPSDLVAHWKFDNNALDLVGGHDGTLNGGVSYSNGQLSEALDFDGVDDYVSVNSFNVVGDQMSLSTWIRADDFDEPEARIISKANGTSAGNHTWMISTINNGGMKIRFRLKTGATTSTLLSSQIINVNTWYHITCTYDGINMRIYIDGIEKGSLANTGNIVNDNNAISIGDNPVGSRKFDGLIDDVRVYSKALSAAEIAGVMNGTVTGVGPISSAGNDVTITNGASTTLNGSGGGSYSWSPGVGLSDSTIANPIASPVVTTRYHLTVTNSQGCSDTSSVLVTVDLQTGLEESDEFEGLKVYPNPSTGNFNIEFPVLKQTLPYRILSVTGQELMRGIINKEKTAINLNTLGEGVYFIEIISGENKHTTRLLTY